MTSIVAAKFAPDQKRARSVRVEALGLETGLPDDARRQLEPGDARFEAFLWAWRYQASWSLEEHRAYWHAHLALWPRAGRPSSAEMLACAVRAAEARGATLAETAEALGYAPDDLRRMISRRSRRGLAGGVITHAEAARPGEAATSYVLPRIYAYPHDEPPDRRAYPNYSRAMLNELAAADPAYQRVADALAEILARRPLVDARRPGGR